MAEKRFATPAPAIATPYTSRPIHPPPSLPRQDGGGGEEGERRGWEDEPNPTRGVTSHPGCLAHAGFPSVYLPLPSPFLSVSVSLSPPVSRTTLSLFSHLNPSHPPVSPLSRRHRSLFSPVSSFTRGISPPPSASPRYLSPPPPPPPRHHRCHYPSITNTTQWDSSPSTPTKLPTSTVSGGDR